MDWKIYLFGLAFVVCVTASFFFALAESALFSLGKWRIQQLAENFPSAGGRVQKLLSEPQDLLAAIVLGNTLANSSLVGITLWFLLLKNWPVWVMLFSLVVGLLFLCEVLPKTLAVRAPEFWALKVASPIQIFTTISRPFREVAQFINLWILKTFTPKSVKPQQMLSEKEYQELLEMAVQQGALGRAEKEIILEIVSLDQKTAADVMKPRATISTIPDDLSKEEMLEVARKSKHTRLPMYDETPDTIIGVLNARALLLDPSKDIEEVIEFPSFVPESMNLLQLLKSLQRQRRGLAIVLDEFGTTAGLVTMEDILEQMLGDFRRGDKTGVFSFQKLNSDRWRVNGQCSIEDFSREYPEIGTVDDVDTMGGLLIRELEVVPNSGQSVIFKGLRLVARQVDERRVKELLVEKVAK
ncbi:MAG: hemolysin family protein [Verrucomicrobiales bacterium]